MRRTFPTKGYLLPLFPLLLAACAQSQRDSADVATPGMPSAELALQQSLDRVHDFMGNLTDRLGAPAQAVAIAPSAPISGVPSLQIRAPIQLAPAASATPTEAVPVTGRNGTTYFAFGGGTPHIRCRSGSACMIHLARGEHASDADVSLANPVGWDARLASAPRKNGEEIVALLPTTGAGTTTLSIRTNQRTYRAELSPVEPGGSSMLLVAFTYRADDPSSQPDPMAAQITVAEGKVPAHYGNPDFSYRVLGATPAWRPLRVYADGGKTYVQFPAGGVLAAPRLLSSSGANGPAALTPITYRIEGDSYVVDRILDDALLIAGTGPQQQTVLLRHVKAS